MILSQNNFNTIKPPFPIETKVTQRSKTLNVTTIICIYCVYPKHDINILKIGLKEKYLIEKTIQVRR